MMTMDMLTLMMMALVRIICGSNLDGGYDVITSTTIEINSVYICDPSTGDREIFVRVNVDGSSWETSTIEATENYETIVWSGETYTYDYEVEDVTLKIYDDDGWLGNELRGSVTYNIAEDLFIDDGSSWITRSFYKAVYNNVDNCYEYLTFTISFDGYYYYTPNPTPSPTPLPTPAPTPLIDTNVGDADSASDNDNDDNSTNDDDDNNGDGGDNDVDDDNNNNNDNLHDALITGIYIIIVIVGLIAVIGMIGCSFCIYKKCIKSNGNKTEHEMNAINQRNNKGTNGNEVRHQNGIGTISPTTHNNNSNNNINATTEGGNYVNSGEPVPVSAMYIPSAPGELISSQGAYDQSSTQGQNRDRGSTYLKAKYKDWNMEVHKPSTTNDYV